MPLDLTNTTRSRIIRREASPDFCHQREIGSGILILEAISGLSIMPLQTKSPTETESQKRKKSESVGGEKFVTPL